MSYNFGGGYTHTANWVPGQPSAQSAPSVYGGVRVERGILSADLSGRYFVQNTPQLFSPELAQTGLSFFSKPYYISTQRQNQEVGARITVAPLSWWRHTVTLGMDRNSLDLVQTQPRLVTSDDTLLETGDQIFTKASIGYNTSISGGLGTGLSGSLTAGFDHYSNLGFAFTAVGSNTTGSISSPPDQPASPSRTLIHNTGYFAQGQLGVRDALFLTAGIRAEQNTNFGDSVGAVVSPRFGASYVQPLGQVTLKLRGAWGRAIRPPEAGAKTGSIGGDNVVLPNFRLTPERQRGWDAGLDLMVGSRGSLSVSYYDQAAENLIQAVLLGTVPIATYQNQNVGRIKNTGVEVEAALTAGALQLRGQYAYTRSRVDDVGPTYTGDLRVDDQVLLIPTHTAGVSLTVAPLSGTTLSAGLTYAGSRTGYDLIALYRCFAGTGPCSADAGFRGYIVSSPGFAKVNATITQQVTRQIAAFASIDNLTNYEAPELEPGFLAIGRISTVGLHVHY